MECHAPFLSRTGQNALKVNSVGCGKTEACLTAGGTRGSGESARAAISPQEVLARHAGARAIHVVRDDKEFRRGVSVGVNLKSLIFDVGSVWVYVTY